MVSTTPTPTSTATTMKPKVSITTAATNGEGVVTPSHNHDPNIFSYQNSSNNSTSSNPYETPPTIHQFHSDDGDPLQQRSVGDTSIRPNIGLTNRYAEHALFGLAYHELMTRLQISVTINALMVLVLLFLTWYLQIFQPIHLALSVVLAVLAFILAMVEGKTIWNNVFSSTAPISSSTSSVTSSTTTASDTTIHVVLKQLEKIGTIILFHPIGKTSYLLICSLLCFFITGVMMSLFCIWFLGNAITLIYCYVTYPECRQSFQEQQQQYERSSSTTADGTDTNNVARSWSSYYSDIANTTTTVTTSWVSERASLLRT